ncbi:MAG: transcriptional regulator KorA [Alphaproteobacteria bacterium]|nr:transcriptional regulator KorA [Alphaproteobacteria bacterium]
MNKFERALRNENIYKAYWEDLLNTEQVAIMFALSAPGLYNILKKNGKRKIRTYTEAQALAKIDLKIAKREGALAAEEIAGMLALPAADMNKLLKLIAMNQINSIKSETENFQAARNREIKCKFLDKKITARQLAKDYKMALAAIYQILHDTGATQNKTKMTGQKKRKRDIEIHDLHAKGMKRREIVEKFGLTKDAVSKIVKRVKEEKLKD